MIETVKSENRKTILAGVRIGRDLRFEARMEELSRLAEACALEPVGQIAQNLERPETGSYIGSGKIIELKELLLETGADCVVFLNTLSPAQLATLAHALEVEVLDKTNLILQIFSERARSREAKMQVEYADLEYMLPRLVGLRQNLSRQGGTGGSMSNKGSGEKQIELDRRHIEKRMSDLRHALRDMERDLETQRKRRQASGLPLVALAGYTNAGKSTLMNSLLTRFQPDEEKLVFEKDMLFATLGTTVRRIQPENREAFLLSDTVGFIEDLPHDLIQAFRSTLSEIRHADLILEVVDYADENYLQHIEVTEETLRELHAGHIPVIYVMNKADLLPLEEKLPYQRGNRIFLSAKQGIGIDELIGMIGAALFGKIVVRDFFLPYKEGALEQRLRTEAEVLSCEYTETGARLTCRLSERMARELRKFSV